MTQQLETLPPGSGCRNARNTVHGAEEWLTAQNDFSKALTPAVHGSAMEQVASVRYGAPAPKAELCSAFFWSGSRCKRFFDAVLVLLAMPVWIFVLALVACWIAVVSPRGGVIFRQTRLGRGGRAFTMYKFRTMSANADVKAHLRYVGALVRSERPLVKRDERWAGHLIRGGRFLRSSGLDELPQLLNVLRGEMSLVGPRPCLTGERDFFPAGRRALRFKVRPGITGWWQIRPKGDATFSEMNALEERYVRESRLRDDLRVLAYTPLAVLRQLRETGARRRVGARELRSTPIAS